MKDLAIYVLFKANQDYLVENVCINRLSPDELCFATCVLEVTIQNNQEQNQEPGTLLDQNQKVVYGLDTLAEPIAFASLAQNIVPTKTILLFSQSFLSDIFQLPECQIRLFFLISLVFYVV